MKAHAPHLLYQFQHDIELLHAEAVSDFSSTNILPILQLTIPGKSAELFGDEFVIIMWFVPTRGIQKPLCFKIPCECQYMFMFTVPRQLLHPQMLNT